MTTQYIPSEDEEQIAFCDYLTARHIKFYHPPAEMYSTSWKQKIRNKRMGATRGFPDLIIPLPERGRLVCIEMKRKKGGKVSDEQFEWLLTLTQCGIHAYVAYGAEMAIELLEEVEKMPKLDYTVKMMGFRTEEPKEPRKKPEDIF